VRIDPRDWLRLPLPTVLLAGVTVAMGAAVLIVAMGGTRANELLATNARVSAPLNLDLAARPRSADLAAMRAQPLLHASRAFYVAPAPAGAPTAPPRPDYRLAGTLILPRKPAVALLTNRAGGTSKRVKPGDELEGWRVQVVDRRFVTLSYRDERFDITASQAPLSAGLKRVPIQRQRVAARGIQSLSATGTASRSMSSPITDTPRLYRPPPN
jgi:hypothetical protein